MPTKPSHETKTVSWFSAGVSSAVATKLAIADVDEIIYTHIDDQHPDTMRFVEDCEAWFGKPITVLQSPYKSVEASIVGCPQRINGSGYINGPRGSSCTRYLKKRVRQEWESQYKFTDVRLRYVWGMDYAEANRADRLRLAMPDFDHVFPLIDRRICKAEAHEILRASGIRRPAMYDLGYRNNNCVGCVKGGKGYWNKIRVDFPEVFAARAALERRANATCINGTWLDELPPDAGRDDGPICDDCGIMCELQRID